MSSPTTTTKPLKHQCQRRSKRFDPSTTTGRICNLLQLLLIALASLAPAAFAQNAHSEPCEPTVLPEVPPAPYYDASEITEAAARQLADYVLAQHPNQAPGQPVSLPKADRERFRRRSNAIGNEALLADEGLLAIALAAPALKLAVVRFREHIDRNQTLDGAERAADSVAFMRPYSRALGEAWNRSDGQPYWGTPFRDCGPLRGRWLWPFSVIVQAGPFKAIAATFIAADDDQCNDALEPIFGKRHICDPTTTFCLQSVPNGSLSARGSYTCLCRFGFHRPGHELQGFDGWSLEQGNYNASSANGTCLPCPAGCSMCDQHGECFDEADPDDNTEALERALKVLLGSSLSSLLVIVLVLAILVYRRRKSRTISVGMWMLLETMLVGVAMMYASVGLHMFPATTWRCLLEPWLRELGFIVCYGSIILKQYRHLVEFRTRKAHRWVLRDVDLLKYLVTMTFAVVCYLAAYTASSVDLIDAYGYDRSNGLREQHTNTCRPQHWDYVTQAAEVCILGFGIHLMVASRNAYTHFRERQFLGLAIVFELLASGSYYVFRYMYLEHISPGILSGALFLRSQLTNTVTLLLVFLPKLWYHQKLGAGGDTSASTSAGTNRAYGMGLTDPAVGEMNFDDLNPDDVRAELRRLYMEVELCRKSKMYLDNPHISKRRGGRKAPHRRFSLQKKGSKDKALSAKHRRQPVSVEIEQTEAEASRTPEESVCSVDGPTDVAALAHRPASGLASPPSARNAAAQ